MEFHTDILFKGKAVDTESQTSSHEKKHIIVIGVVCPSVRIYNNNNYDMLFFM